MASSGSSSSGKSTIKNVLESFCRILRYLEIGKLVPEDFRLAKLNNSQVSIKFWKLLYRLLRFISEHNQKRLQNGHRSQNEEDWDEFKFKREHFKFIKSELVKLGFEGVNELEIEAAITTKNVDDDQLCFFNYSSRNLLLIIGWLFSSLDLLDLFLLDFRTHDDLNDDNDQEEEKNEMLEMGTEDDGELCSRLNRLKYLRHSCQQNLNGTASCLDERLSIGKKMKELVRKDSIIADSINDLLPVDVTKKPLSFLIQMDSSIKAENEFLKDFYLMLANESLFWEWMETLVEAKSNENDNEENDDDQSAPLSRLPHHQPVELNQEDAKSFKLVQARFRDSLKLLAFYLESAENKNENDTNDVDYQATENNNKIIDQLLSLSSMIVHRPYGLDEAFEFRSRQHNKFVQLKSCIFNRKFADSVNQHSLEHKLYLSEQNRSVKRFVDLFNLINECKRKQLLNKLNDYLSILEKLNVTPISLK